MSLEAVVIFDGNEGEGGTVRGCEGGVGQSNSDEAQLLNLPDFIPGGELFFTYLWFNLSFFEKLMIQEPIENVGTGDKICQSEKTCRLRRKGS